MQTLVIFDIGCTRLRNAVINTCQDFGLDRIQFSVFQGALKEAARERLTAKFASLIEAHVQKEKGPQRGQALHIHLFPICSEEMAKALHLSRKSVAPVVSLEIPKNLFV